MITDQYGYRWQIHMTDAHMTGLVCEVCGHACKKKHYPYSADLLIQIGSKPRLHAAFRCSICHALYLWVFALNIMTASIEEIE